MINLRPTECNICGGSVEYVSNATIYGREYGSGRCYLCTDCRAYVGTHKTQPRNALGILADAEMRDWKIKCHELFDPLWNGDRKARNELYGWLAEKLGIDHADCHFGYFDMPMLERAYEILTSKES